ncbi:cell wall-active antibiotics response protein LiaF [Lederbergia citrea]|uniref:Cell wall-active antibiotics response protein n=1 Tax=Lederbergia citrea TaxID=2833581 RepID=A0A942UR54_9BACI|nr:cell wall-active antibiotics response protein LiaF [Lederbergia citrea]MBS4177284.1 cell wall-active antibiotics response protein [Lederbergia citrea]MBS4221469.1 cell wall-active antibiotics response protein [Lederbergia citrea]
MKKMSKTSLIGWFMLITAIGMGLEILLNWRLFIPLLIGCFLIYKGKISSKNRNVYLIIGLSLLAIPILSSAFLKFFIFAAVIYGLIEYSKSKKQAQKIIVETIEPEPKSSQIKKKRPFIKNMFVGSQRVVNEVFEWDDINIQCGFGDTVIDLGMTMLPQGESVVVIRNLVGNIQLLVPFDASVVINHSSISGKLKVFNDETELFNSNIIYYPDSGQQTLRTIKIITNVLVGNVEVKRI